MPARSQRPARPTPTSSSPTSTPSTRHQHAIDVPTARSTEVLSHRYGTSCTRKGCVYRHPPKPPKKVHVPKTSEICVHYVSGCCSFAEKCHMRHPGKAEAQKFRETCASIACRFGVDCANPNCLYDHTGSGRTRGAAACTLATSNAANGTGR